MQNEIFRFEYADDEINTCEKKLDYWSGGKEKSMVFSW